MRERFFMSKSRLKIFLFWGRPIFIFVLITFRIFKKLRIKNIIKRFKVHDVELELCDEKIDSYFDRHLSEVLYLFESSEAHIIVFEDLDRYNNNAVFARLRKINTLLNCESRVSKRIDGYKIKFLYLLRDDLFISKDRTKFFDFIIPIIPAIGSSNSFEQLKKLFADGKIEVLNTQEYSNTDRNDILSTGFLRSLCLYVDDMRILKNIYNEFIVYRDKLCGIEEERSEPKGEQNENEAKQRKIDLNYVKLLSIITYKNIFPTDFDQLLLGRGFVYTMLKDGANLLNEKILAEKNELLLDKKEELRKFEESIVQKKEELDAIMFLSSYTIAHVNGKPEKEFGNRVEFVKEIEANPENVSFHGSSHSSSVVIKKDFETMREKPEYTKRLELIEGGKKGFTDAIKDVENIKNLSLVDSCAKYDNADEIFQTLYFVNDIYEKDEFIEVKRNHYFSLLKYLITNGYIDELYLDYINYFYEGDLTVNDKNFVMYVKESKGYLRQDYKLDNPEIVALEYLELADFKKKQVLNYDLVYYVLSERKMFTDKLLKEIKELLKQVDNLSFLDGFLKIEKNNNCFKKWVIIHKDYLDNLDGTIVLSLIGYDIIQMTKDHLELMCRMYFGLLKNFIEHNSNINGYVNIIKRGEVAFNDDELLIILDSSNISNEPKLELLDLTQNPIQISNKNYDDAVLKHILKHNFDENDIFNIVEKYDDYKPDVQNLMSGKILEFKNIRVLTRTGDCPLFCVNF